MKDAENKVDVVDAIVNQWTEHYPPAGEDEMFALRLTSYEIAEILSEFAEIGAGDITRILLMKGYKLVRTGDGSMKWLIQKNIDK